MERLREESVEGTGMSTWLFFGRGDALYAIAIKKTGKGRWRKKMGWDGAGFVGRRRRLEGWEEDFSREF